MNYKLALPGGPASEHLCVHTDMHACMRACMYTCIRIHIHRHAHMQIQIHRHMHTHTHTYPHIHTCTHAHTCMHACIHAYMHTCTHVHMHTCIHAKFHHVSVFVLSCFDCSIPCMPWLLGNTCAANRQLTCRVHGVRMPTLYVRPKRENITKFIPNLQYNRHGKDVDANIMGDCSETEKQQQLSMDESIPLTSLTFH